MKLKITNVRTRPDVTISWISPDDSGNNLDGENSVAGKLLSTSNALSADGLTMTTVQVWASKAIYLEYLQLPDVIALRSERSLWQIDHLVSSNIIYEEIE